MRNVLDKETLTVFRHLYSGGEEAQLVNFVGKWTHRSRSGIVISHVIYGLLITDDLLVGAVVPLTLHIKLPSLSVAANPSWSRAVCTSWSPQFSVKVVGNVA